MSPEKMMVGRLVSGWFSGDICSFPGGVVCLVFAKKKELKTAMLFHCVIRILTGGW